MMLKVQKSEINFESGRMKELKFPLWSVNPMPLLSKNKEKVVLDQEIEDLRESQAALNRERLLANQLLDVVNILEPDGIWVEQERTEESVLFVRLNGVYTLRAKAEPELITGRVRDLEYSRSENVRSLLVDDLIAAGLNP